MDLNRHLRVPTAAVTRPEISEMDLRDKTWSSCLGNGISVGASLDQITAHPFIEFNQKLEDSSFYMVGDPDNLLGAAPQNKVEERTLVPIKRHSQLMVDLCSMRQKPHL